MWSFLPGAAFGFSASEAGIQTAHHNYGLAVSFALFSLLFLAWMIMEWR